MKKLTIRADGSNQIGLGHIYRGLSLSEMLHDSFEMSFAIFKPDARTKQIISGFGLDIIELDSQLESDFAAGKDVVIVDGYWYKNDYILQLREKAAVIVEIDDIPRQDYYSALVINHALGSNYKESKFHDGSRLLSGPQYALLRTDFLKADCQSRTHKLPLVVTINMGGSDPQNNTLRLLELLAKTATGKIKEIHLLIGSSYRFEQTLSEKIKATEVFCKLHSGLDAGEIKQLLQKSDLFLCPASTIAYEACAVGVPLIVFQTADNQLNIYKGLVDAKAAVSGGRLDTMSETELEQKLSDCLCNYKQFSDCVQLQHRLIDGRSGQRVKEEILALCV